MKLRQILTVIFCTVALLSAVNMQAARSKTQRLLVLYPGTVAGAHLARGKYRVKCETSGTIAKLTFVLHRKVIATVEGQVDYVKNEVHLRGTFVPLYGLNNMFGQIPIVGLFLGGGSNEGLVGITYEAVGPIASPRILVNPVTAIAPGLLRKFIPSPGDFDPNFASLGFGFQF